MVGQVRDDPCQRASFAERADGEPELRADASSDGAVDSPPGGGSSTGVAGVRFALIRLDTMPGAANGSAYSVPKSGAAAAADIEQLVPGQVPDGGAGGLERGPRQEWRRARVVARTETALNRIYVEQSFAAGRRLQDLFEMGERHHKRNSKPTGSSTACCGCQPLNPESNKRLVWDILLVLFLLYVACIVPARIAFDTSVKLGSGVFWFETGVDMFFLCDIVLNFRTSVVAVTDSGYTARVDDKRFIAVSYMKGWFLIDLIAVLPYSYIELVVSHSEEKGGSTQQVFKALRLVRMAKLLRLTKMVPLLRRLDDRFEGLFSTSKLLSTMFVVMYITHLVGCAWYAVGQNNEVLPGDQTISGWVSSQEWSEDVPPTTRWLRSFYWAMTTLTTVGVSLTLITFASCRSLRKAPLTPRLMWLLLAFAEGGTVR